MDRKNHQHSSQTGEDNSKQRKSEELTMKRARCYSLRKIAVVDYEDKDEEDDQDEGEKSSCLSDTSEQSPAQELAVVEAQTKKGRNHSIGDHNSNEHQNIKHLEFTAVLEPIVLNEIEAREGNVISSRNEPDESESEHIELPSIGTSLTTASNAPFRKFYRTSTSTKMTNHARARSEKVVAWYHFTRQILTSSTSMICGT
ncbi:uncharacterized protein LOC142350776 isoform X2 [Convolutriloba macropyga]|uniref:uncharacterized protein LOC142350776 isoform X2 n=1 Tax=Convolutriloba macropyga TaxID=536237 RepID=UPI003F525CA7